MSQTFHITRCPVCGNSSFDTHLETRDWLVTKEAFTILSCTSCSFKFTQDAPLEVDSGRYYDDVKYVEHSDSSSGLIFKIYHQARKIMLSLKLRLLRKVNTGNRLMDVGSGSGYFLNHMKNHGFECTGVEISEAARKLCADKFGIAAHHPDELISLNIHKSFDLITMWHVFEHVYTYDAYFESFKKLLDHTGTLVIAMPNYRCYDARYYHKYWNGYDVPRHLWHFDSQTFKRFANDRGFEIIKTYRLPLDPFYNCMVSEEYKPKNSFLMRAVFIGFVSYLTGLFSKSKASSLVYVLKKNN